MISEAVFAGGVLVITGILGLARLIYLERSRKGKLLGLALIGRVISLVIALVAVLGLISLGAVMLNGINPGDYFFR